MADQSLIDKIRSLPPEKLAEVEDFVDFLKMRDEDRLVTFAAIKLSEDSYKGTPLDARNYSLTILPR